MKFSTWDADNDLHAGDGNCADEVGGGWWFNNCYQVCITCEASHSFMSLELQTSRMMIKQHE